MSVPTNFSILVFYFICCEVLPANSRTSTLWKLNSDETKIIEASPFHQVVAVQNGIQSRQYVTEEDPIFNIITSTIHQVDNNWMKKAVEYYCTDCNNVQSKSLSDRNEFVSNSSKYSIQRALITDGDETLDCGKPVNFTYYDNLVGVLNRNRHPLVPEPQASLVFSKTRRNAKGDLDIDLIERRLKKAKKEKPKSVQLYNQIGNFWRIKGDAQKSIECFRRALAVSPHNAEVLLNLARVLYNLQYLDDAIYLTRRSLEVQSPEKGAWQQHFTLGEIYKAYGHYQEASVHLRHTLELRPGFEPAEVALKEMESLPTDSIHIYTLIIIVCLVLGVLLVILSTVETLPDTEFPDVKTQRHFNKAMAMKTLRGLSMKNGRYKKISL